MEYQVVRVDGIVNLHADVARLLKDGWRPEGGVALKEEEGHQMYFQVMVRSEPAPAEEDYYSEHVMKGWPIP